MSNYFLSKQKGLSLFIGLNLFVFSVTLHAQSIILNNPSFEGPTGANKQPPPWAKCNFNTPDTQPGVFGISLSAYDGNTYIGLTDNLSHGFQEMVGQLLPSPLQANKTYSLNLKIAYVDYVNLGGKAGLEIWGGITTCSKDELLWKSDTVTNTTWKQYYANFTPNNTLNYLLIVCKDLLGNGPYLLVDDLSTIEEVKPKIWFTIPSKDTIISCSQSLSGRSDKTLTKVEIKSSFLIKTIQATLLTDTTWQSNGFAYPKNCLQKNDTLITYGYFANGDITEDTIHLTINCKEDTCGVSPSPVQLPNIPNMITPNKDGKNDFFEILNLPPIHHLEIYNRWGQNVFESSDYKNDWQGEEGVYYYILTANNKIYKGWLQVIGANK